MGGIKSRQLSVAPPRASHSSLRIANAPAKRVMQQLPVATTCGLSKPAELKQTGGTTVFVPLQDVRGSVQILARVGVRQNRRDNDIERARQHVRTAEERVARQKTLIAALQAEGRSTKKAVALLAELERALIQYRNYMETLQSLVMIRSND